MGREPLCYVFVSIGQIGPGGGSNTGVVHTRDQRFSKHTLIDILPS